jgi:Lon protease-like protein
MRDSSLRPHELPPEIPVFPLTGALLLPHGRLPLNIFEPRYKAMVEDALANGRMFGMVQPDPTLPDAPNGPALYRVGCLGRLSSFSETDDGRYLISVNGLIRFQVTAEIEGRRGYRRVASDFSRFVADLTEGPAPVPSRAAVVQALRNYFTARGFDANWEAIDAMEDGELMVTLCMVCPFEPSEKQALLEAPDTMSRASTLLALLQMGAHSFPDSGQTVS